MSLALRHILAVREAADWQGMCATVRSQRRHCYSRHVISPHFSLAPKSRFPAEAARGRDGSNADYAEGSPSIWCCRDLCVLVPVSFPPDRSYRALNPFGTVPFLQDGNVSMSESVAMMFYIAQKYGPTDTLPPVGDERFAKVLQFTLLGEASV
jgi:hypothetical protein